MRMKVQLEVELDVDQEMLKDNPEPITDEQIANLVHCQVSEGCFYIDASDAVSIDRQRVLRISWIMRS